MVILIASAMTFIAIAKVGAIDPNRLHKEYDYEHTHDGRQKYTCSMHPEVVTDHPGNCPKCGMQLVPRIAKTRAAHATDGAHATHRSHMSHPSHEITMHSSVN
ncbi:MAG: heavy metal-binding domain-containing protein, partial [Candidatus Udaeobacter sp.]